MKDAVRKGAVETEEWTVRNGQFVRTPKKQRDDVHHLTPVAQQRLKRALYDEGDSRIDD